jgi:predicted deacylase
LRFDEEAIETGVTGILRVLASLKMISLAPHSGVKHQTAISFSSTWLRAPEGGVLRSSLPTGAHVSKGEQLGEISNPLGDSGVPVIAEDEGIIIGRTNLPIANRGDALFHVARMKKSDLVQAPLFDEDEII